MFTWESLTKFKKAYLKLSNYMAVSKHCNITALAPFDSVFTSISSSKLVYEEYFCMQRLSSLEHCFWISLTLDAKCPPSLLTSHEAYDIESTMLRKSSRRWVGILNPKRSMRLWSVFKNLRMTWRGTLFRIYYEFWFIS